MDKPRIYADLNKWEEVAGQFRVILTTLGTAQDLQEQDIVLREGLALEFWTDDGDEMGKPNPLYFSGVLHYDEKAGRWVAAVDPSEIRHAAATVEGVRQKGETILV